MKKLSTVAVACATALSALVAPATAQAAEGVEPTGLVRDSIVRVGAPGVGICSGVAVGDHWVLTAKHCAKGMRSLGPLSTGVSPNLNISSTGKVHLNRHADFALVNTKEKYTKCSPIAAKSPKSGDRVSIVGFGGSHYHAKQATFDVKWDYTSDLYSDNSSKAKYFRANPVTGRSVRGDSGGPVLNKNEEVVGIMSHGHAVPGTADDDPHMRFENMGFPDITTPEVQTWLKNTMGVSDLSTSPGSCIVTNRKDSTSNLTQVVTDAVKQGYEDDARGMILEVFAFLGGSTLFVVGLMNAYNALAGTKMTLPNLSSLPR